MLTNRQVISAYKNKQKLKTQHKELKSELDRIQSKLGILGEKIYYANLVDEIYEGVALSDGEHAVGDDIDRHAHIYLNAHNKTTWGIRFKIWTNDHRGYIEGWGGADNTEEEVRQWAKDWIVSGTLPDKVSKYDRKKLLEV